MGIGFDACRYLDFWTNTLRPSVAVGLSGGCQGMHAEIPVNNIAAGVEVFGCLRPGPRRGKRRSIGVANKS